MFFDFPVTRIFFDFPWRFELSGVDCNTSYIEAISWKKLFYCYPAFRTGVKSTKNQRKDCENTDPLSKSLKPTLFIFILKYLARIWLLWTTYGNDFPGNSTFYHCLCRNCCIWFSSSSCHSSVFYIYSQTRWGRNCC